MRVCSEPEPLFASQSLSYGYIAMSRSSTVYLELSPFSGLLPPSDELKISLFHTVEVSSSDSFRILLGLDIPSSDLLLPL